MVLFILFVYAVKNKSFGIKPKLFISQPCIYFTVILKVKVRLIDLKSKLNVQTRYLHVSIPALTKRAFLKELRVREKNISRFSHSQYLPRCSYTVRGVYRFPRFFGDGVVGITSFQNSMKELQEYFIVSDNICNE